MAYQFSQTGAEIQAILNNAEDKTNKVTAISSASTDTQYASAKCVYEGTLAKDNSSQGKMLFGIDDNGMYVRYEI